METPLFKQLQKRYDLSPKIIKLSEEEENKLIERYQDPKTSNQEKKRIVEMFWDMNKNRIVNYAVINYQQLKKYFQGEINFEIEDLIDKGFLAIPHCLKIFKNPTRQPKETLADFKKRQKAAKNSKARFGTVLTWWLKPFMTNHIEHENFLIYVPHSKNSKVKSVPIDSYDKLHYDDGHELIIDSIPSSDQTPEEFTARELFWETVKNKTTPEEYEFIHEWLNLEKSSKAKQAFFKKHNMTQYKVIKRIREISTKFGELFKDWIW